MYTEKTVITKFNILLASGCVETTKSKIVYRDEVEIARENHSCCYMPTELDKIINDLGSYLPAEIDYLTAKWTPEFIDNYKAKVLAENPVPV